jgi:hypothetical protein
MGTSMWDSIGSSYASSSADVTSLLRRQSTRVAGQSITPYAAWHKRRTCTGLKQPALSDALSLSKGAAEGPVPIPVFGGYLEVFYRPFTPSLYNPVGSGPVTKIGGTCVFCFRVGKDRPVVPTASNEFQGGLNDT